ncbi:MAG: GMC family oxidoreductase [Actinobacteria bacterium]|nr:GMC family oxidoreductase [Actinomycetota bacterium]MCL6094679.1 GMC family oxidoreductase [Actinomycetota bacterium]
MTPFGQYGESSASTRSAFHSSRTRPPKRLQELCGAILPLDLSDPELSLLARKTAEFLDKQPTVVRAGVLTAATILEAASLAFYRRPIAKLETSKRERLLSRLEHNRYSAQALSSLKALVLLVYGTDHFSAETFQRATSSPPARPDPVLNLTSAIAWPSITTCDIVVVGSGAGGAMAARSLARAGMDVIVVEEGSSYSVDDFREDLPIDRFTKLYRDGGTTMAIGRPPIVLPIGRAVGGTTVINSGTCFKTPSTVVHHWHDSLGLALAEPDRFNDYLDEVFTTLQVAPVREEVMGRNGELCLVGAEKLGWSAGPIVRNAPGCEGCCQCAIGCPTNAKFGVHLNALPQACQAGARIVSEARVTRILMDDNRAIGIEAMRRDGSRLVIKAPTVLVAAGATETPLLLRRSGIGSHPFLGSNLAIHPAVSVAGRFEEPVFSWRGVLQSAEIDEFHESHGILIEATATPPGMGSIMLPGYGRHLLWELNHAEQLASLGAMVADESTGKVLGKNHALIRYDLGRHEGLMLLQSIKFMGEALFAAGALEVLTGIPSKPIVHDLKELQQAVENADYKDLHIAAFHPSGTAAAGGSAAFYPLNSRGELRGVSGVWVADASILPSSPRVNPQVSIMALSLAVADSIIAKAEGAKS